MNSFESLLASTFAICCVLIVVSWWIYIPWFIRLLKRRDPAAHEPLRDWTFLSSSETLDVCLYFLRREYQRSFDASIRRHGGILRWTFSFPLMLGTLTLLVALAGDVLV